VIDIGRPPAGRIGGIESGARAQLREHRRIQRICWPWDQDFAALIDDRAQGEIDRLRRPGRDEHAVGRHRKPARRVFCRDRFAGRGETRRGSVPVMAVSHRALDHLDKRRRCLEPERHGIADVEVTNSRARSLDTPRLRHDVADGIRKTMNTVRHRNAMLRAVCERHGGDLIVAWPDAPMFCINHRTSSNLISRSGRGRAAGNPLSIRF
jgi:hypothetical protein